MKKKRVLSKETKLKISLAMIGEKNHFWGKKHKPETLLLIGAASKGRKQTKESKEKSRLRALGNKYALGYHNPNPRKVYVLSKETKEKISKAHKKITLPQVFKKGFTPWNKGLKGFRAGESNNKWKGEEASYRAKHIWIETRLGKPHFCEECGRKDLNHRQYQWASISHLYKRQINDWRRLCAKCHKRYDRAVHQNH